jgi:hydrogenase expression/formation protein HypD
MKYVDEFRNAADTRRLAQAIAQALTRPHTLMEICGGQTHAIVRFGIDALLPSELTLVHGPGCPVCVTPVALIDKAVALALEHGVILCSFGDMLRVPGSELDLLRARSRGGDVRMVYSPLDALKLAQDQPARQVVFFGVGFETTAPGNALAVRRARELGLRNFSLLSSHVLVPPAMEALLSSPACRVQGFLAAGHVCTVMGYRQYEPLAARHHVPVVVTGFEPADLLHGILRCVLQREAGRAEVENAYTRSVSREGNLHAQALLEEVFEVVPREWRGLGLIPQSGLGLRNAYRDFDAQARFDLPDLPGREASVCIAGRILQGLDKPRACPAFGTECTPEHPLGAPMVSSEGACAAYYRYGRAGATL